MKPRAHQRRNRCPRCPATNGGHGVVREQTVLTVDHVAGQRIECAPATVERAPVAREVVRPIDIAREQIGRAQLFEVLLGRPDFEPITDEEKYQDDGVTVEEVVADLGAVVTGAAPLLPDSLATWLRPDLSLEAAMVSRTN